MTTVLPSTTLAQLDAAIARHPYPLLFATLSGAHLYGFPSPDSDFDVRGVHLLPIRELVGLPTGDQTVTTMVDEDGLDLDLVTHEARKFFELLLRRNGYVLEQLYSPLVLQATPFHDELKAIARGCITRHHAHHYLGFSRNEWKLFEKEEPRRVKPLLYVFRVLLTGLHLIRTGEIEANLLKLNAEAGLPYLDELIARKMGAAEQTTLDEGDLSFYRGEFERLTTELERERDRSQLAEEPTARAALHDLLLRVRLG